MNCQQVTSSNPNYSESLNSTLSEDKDSNDRKPNLEAIKLSLKLASGSAMTM
ncbi:18118_t:CDS:2, partial [Racocetra persica]